MKDWEKLEADVNKLLTKHYTKGRGGYKVEFVVVHYNAGNLTINGCYSVWQAREASAHYQVEDDGDIGQLVWDGNTAWHAGDWVANCKSIGIEHANLKDGTITEAALDNGAHLVAAVCKYYGLGRPTWLNVVFPHKHFSATSCPGQIYGSQKDAYIKRAQYWYDKMTGAEVPDEPEVEEPVLEVDGLWGPKTSLRLQQVLGAPFKDGIISRQNKYWKGSCPGCTDGWEWLQSGYGEGSQTIALLQKKTGAKVDGILGEETINKLIAYYMKKGSGAKVLDGKLDYESLTVKAMQKALNSGKF